MCPPAFHKRRILIFLAEVNLITTFHLLVYTTLLVLVNVVLIYMALELVEVGVRLILYTTQLLRVD